jgi:hypothetical protein
MNIFLFIPEGFYAKQDAMDGVCHDYWFFGPWGMQSKKSQPVSG